MMMSTKLVETLVGKGEIFEGNVRRASVSYWLNCYEDVESNVVLKRRHRLKLASVIEGAIPSATELVLRLADGRSVDIIRNPRGFIVLGAIRDDLSN
jgi:hypothetical protein